MADIVALDSGNPLLDLQFVKPSIAAQVDRLDVYALPEADLTPYVGMIVGTMIDQEFLFRERHHIRNFLDQGRVLVFSGHLFRDWLPSGQPFVPRIIRTTADYAVRRVRPHPIFDNISEEDLTSRKGVAGFFARGHHPVPPSAEVVLSFADGEPIVYVDRASTAGTIVVHAGNDLLGYGGDDSTARLLATQLLDWIHAEACELKLRVRGVGA